MSRTPHRSGFTMIELLVVLGIISILLTLAITVGRSVTKGGEDRITKDNIRVLDTTLTAWYADKEAKFPAYLLSDGAPGTDSGERAYPIIDGCEEMSSGSGATEPTLAAYLIVASDSASVEQTLRQQIGPKYLANDALRWTFGGGNPSFNGQSGFGLTIADAWGRPIRFVHPMWSGGYGRSVTAAGRPARDVPAKGQPNTIKYARSFRASAGAVGDADEGICPGNRPYFYSSGRDKDPGTRDDNIYTTVPSFPPETPPEQ